METRGHNALRYSTIICEMQKSDGSPSMTFLGEDSMTTCALKGWRTALAVLALSAMAPGARAVAPTLVVASTLTSDSMYAGFLLPVTSKEFL
jgi:hypothetical protein